MTKQMIFPMTLAMTVPAFSMFYHTHRKKKFFGEHCGQRRHKKVFLNARFWRTFALRHTLEWLTFFYATIKSEKIISNYVLYFHNEQGFGAFIVA